MLADWMACGFQGGVDIEEMVSSHREQGRRGEIEVTVAICLVGELEAATW